MREYINRLARGNFIYQRPVMELETENINGSVTVGECAVFTFRICSEEEIRGVVYSDNRRISFESGTFCGTTADIVYTVDANGLKVGNTVSGKIYFVSNAGEYSVKYDFSVIEERVHTGSGDAYNMFHFANLVQLSPEEAAGIFKSLDFKRIFLKDDTALVNIYDTVKNTPNINDAMEEFLIAVRKKSPVTIDVSYTKKVFSDFEESCKESIEITRSSWGYVKLYVSADTDFIELKTDSISSEAFTGNKYELEYVINKEKLHAGKNFGRISIQTFSQEHYISIEADTKGIQRTQYERKHARLELTKEYLEFRMKRQDKKSWQDHSNRIIDRIRGIDDTDVFFKLAQAQIFLTQNREEEALWLVESVKDEIVDNKDKNIEQYCYFLYVSALAYKNKSYTFGAIKTIKSYYENGSDTWRILWLLLYIDSSQDSNISIKLIRLKDSFHNGCVSPIMYYEALQIMNKQPTLLRVLNDFEIQVLLFGCKYKVISSKLALYACELISNEKVAQLKYLKLLYAFNELFDNDEILQVLVTHMIRNELTGSEYAALYEKGILRGLRITRLYEFYMESLDKSNMRRLPQIVVRYFYYESVLSRQTESYLYANIITNLENSRETISVYGARIEKFGFEQMRQGYIDEFLAIIYEYLLRNIVVNEDTAGFLSRYLFTYKITVFDPSITSVLVKHKELRKGQRCHVVNQTAYVQIYTKDCVVMFEDTDKSVRKGSVHYEIERVYENPSYLDSVCEYCKNDLYIRLYLYERSLERRKYDEDTVTVCMQLMDNGYVNAHTRTNINTWLIQYYHDYYYGDDFSRHFADIHKEDLNQEAAAMLIETCIASGMYKNAFELVCNYGFEAVSAVKLFRMVRNIIAEGIIMEENKVLMQCCCYVFEEGKYDENVLSYMAEYYNASNRKMFLVWRACVGFKVECIQLAERIIAQRLFSGYLGDRLSEIFAYYYQNRADEKVVIAYISENSYEYFVKKNEVDENIFQYIAACLLEKKALPVVCKAAYLKYFSDYGAEQLTDSHIMLLQKLLDELCMENTFFEFYGAYKGRLEIPYNAVDRTTVEYRTEPEARVQIFYRYNESDDYIGETLSCKAGGVYTKSFVLFYGESIQYYFLEDSKNGSRKTDICNLLCNNVAPKKAQGRFDDINDMLVSMEMHDMATMKKLMREYCVQNYVTMQLFKPM